MYVIAAPIAGTFFLYKYSNSKDPWEIFAVIVASTGIGFAAGIAHHEGQIAESVRSGDIRIIERHDPTLVEPPERDASDIRGK